MKQDYNRAMGQIHLPPSAEKRILAALEGGAQENRAASGLGWRAAVVLAALAVLMTGTVFAVAYRAGLLEGFFHGDTSILEPYVKTAVASVESEDYRLTVDSALNDGLVLYTVITVEGLNDRAIEDLKSNKVIAESHRELWGQAMVDSLMKSGDVGPETFWACFADSGAHTSGISRQELEAASETSRSWRLEISLMNANSSVESGPVLFWLDFMGREYAVQIPTDQAMEAVELSINREVSSECPDCPPILVRSLELSPVSLSFVEEYPSASEIGENAALVLLRMKDGRVVTRSQLEYSLRSMRWLDEEGRQRRVIYQTDWPLDLEQVSAVILGDLEFPLDGSEPFRIEVDPYLLPFEAELYRYPVGEEQGRNYIADVEALCKELGAQYTWNGESRTGVAEYRGVTVSLTAGSSTALVDGNPVEMETQITSGEVVPLPAVEREGKLSAIVTVFTDAWGIGVEARMSKVDGIPTEYVDFLVLP